MPEISLLMPCYNAAATLPEALTSIAAQTFAAYEVVAVDDGSTDATPGLLAEAARRDPRWRVLAQPHGGILTALNAGLAACRGAFIARMDADDRMHPARLEVQRAWFPAHPETDVLGCRVEPLGPAREGFRLYLDWQNSLMTDEDIRRERFVESPLAHPGLMLRREAYDRLGGYEEHGWAEDYDLLLRAAQAGLRFAKTPESLLAWRDHPERLTRTDARYSPHNFARARVHYLAAGPLAGRDALILWGAGESGRRFSKLLKEAGHAPAAYVDVDPRRIGSTRYGRPILPPEVLPAEWARYRNPVLLAAVGARGARALIRARLEDFGLVEGRDWWAAA
ncbi:MAG: glycosyltransferase family 2 protein [Chloroflexi bacterium]|nr:glycosyltransferase family 2 protein [Chloroflexota bacterium]